MKEYTTTFENLYIRQEATKLFLEMYGIFNKTTFRDYFFKDQLLRATLSISNNIAEGYERETKKELIRFLFIAKGSAGEVRNMVLLAKKLDYIEESYTLTTLKRLNQISA
jgi:four helix bundle protein